MSKFDPSNLTSTEFEEYCFELLKKLPFNSVDWRKGTSYDSSPSDRGRDIECKLTREDIDGSEVHETWFVECKHYKEGVPPTKLHNILAWAQAERPHVALIIASGFLSNPAKDYLENYRLKNLPPYRIKYWERPQLEELNKQTFINTKELTIAQLLDKHLISCNQTKEKRTVESYQGHFDSFLAHMGDNANLHASKLKTYHIMEWLESRKGWSKTYVRNAIMAIQVAYNWAVKREYLHENPIKNIQKPKASQRDNQMTREDFDKMLALVKESDPFRDFLVFFWNTDCLPQQARHIESRHIKLDKKCIVIPKAETKGKRKDTVIRLESPALEIMNKLMQKNREGKLLINTRKEAWTKYAVCERFNKLSKGIGKIGKPYAPSDCRNGAKRCELAI